MKADSPHLAALSLETGATRRKARSQPPGIGGCLEPGLIGKLENVLASSFQETGRQY